MKTIKIIDLLNKIANGEEIPKYVKYYDKLRKTEDTMMCCYNNIIYKLDNNIIDLLDEVEILEEEKQETKPITKKDFETLGYACGEIQKAFTNGWTKSLENKPLKEKKKIPEKLKYILKVDDLILPPVDENMYKIWKQTIKNHNKINEILDYLESKEDE